MLFCRGPSLVLSKLVEGNVPHETINEMAWAARIGTSNHLIVLIDTKATREMKETKYKGETMWKHVSPTNKPLKHTVGWMETTVNVKEIVRCT